MWSIHLCHECGKWLLCSIAVISIKKGGNLRSKRPQWGKWSCEWTESESNCLPRRPKEQMQNGRNSAHLSGKRTSQPPVGPSAAIPGNGSQSMLKGKVNVLCRRMFSFWDRVSLSSLVLCHSCIYLTSAGITRLSNHIGLFKLGLNSGLAPG